MRRCARGFTLIELMVVVAIIGLLASIAIPELRNMQLRSRQAERAIMVTTINRAINDYYLRQDGYPHAQGNGSSLLLLDPNPDWMPGTVKRAFRSQGNPADDWKWLSVVIEGGVYYSYRGWGRADPAQDPPRFHAIQVLGDLDGDGVQDDLTKIYEYVGGGLSKPVGSTAEDCSLEVHLPANWPAVF